MTFFSKKLLQFSFLCFIFACTGIHSVNAQGVDFKWKDEGPDNMGGRTRSIAIRKDGRLYAGSPLGGLWTSNNRGRNWNQVESYNKPSATNRNVCLSVSSIAIDPQNEDLMVIGTGELGYKYDGIFDVVGRMNATVRGYYGFSGLPGKGVYISTDGGRTFTNNNSTWPNQDGTDYSVSNPWISVQKVAIGGNRIFAATLKGLYYSDDRFATEPKLAQETYEPQTLVAADKKLSASMVFDIEVAGNSVYVTTSDYLFVSRDNGATFSEVYGNKLIYRDPLEDSTKVNPINKGRMEVAVAPSDPNVVYLVETTSTGLISGFWISRDGGKTWNYTTPPLQESIAPNFNISNGKGIFSLALTVDPGNPNYVYLGSYRMAMKRPQDGWRILASGVESFPGDATYAPTNVHTITPDPSNRRIYYLGTDREIVRMIITPPFSGFRDTTIRFENATGNYNASGAIAVSVNGFGNILATVENAGLVYKDARTLTGSYNLLEDRRVLTRSGQQAMGWVASSVFDTAHSVISAGGLFLQRTLDAGLSYEPLISATIADDNCRPDSLDFKSITADNAVDNLYAHAFKLHEIIDRQNPYVNYNFVRFEGYDTVPNPRFGEDNEPRNLIRALVSGRDSFNLAKKQYVFLPSKQNIWRCTNPFGKGQIGLGKERETDTVLAPAWTRLNPENAFLENERNGTNALVTSINVSPDNSLWFGTVNGNIFRITDASNTCVYQGTNKVPNPNFKLERIVAPPLNVSDGADVMAARWVTSITFHPTHPDTAVITYGGYDASGQNRNNGMIFMTYNASAPVPTFFPIHFTENLPYFPVYCAMYNPKDPESWLAFGTENGIYTIDPKTINATDASANKFTEANNGDMARVPVYGFAYQEYGFGVEKINYTIKITDGSGGVRPVEIQFTDVADFVSDVLSYPTALAKHDNVFSRNMSLNEYTANLATIRNAANEILPLDRNQKMSFLNGRLVKKSEPVRDEILATFSSSDLRFEIVRSTQVDLPTRAEKSVGKLFIASYGRGIMSTDILADNPKTTSRPTDNINRYNREMMYVYPNPTDNQTNISMRIPAPKSRVTFEIYSMDGRKIDEQTFNPISTGRTIFELSTERLNTGIYIVKGTLQSGHSIQTQSLKLNVIK